ncbi:hypothetical protein EJB05_05009 [Eragrostis curvula]|uniref:Ethylene-insensitive protein 2 n=1 Tax=Eragrostis curvula TaxID=38414 RepID=A0A5J9WDP1_9POAL|nr:hypothetical protein EJB05_05009 [Eragrostis curvula]
MDGVRGITSLAAGDGRHHLFRTLGPTLLISMAYIDLGKWVATVDAGARFGYDLVLLVLLFNCSAILCQYLSISIGMVTGKNLAEEYSQAICAVLGLQAGLSLLISEVTMVVGIAVGFNLVLEYDDVVAGICFSSVAINLLPYIISRLDKRMAGTFNACIAGFTLLCFVLGVLVSQPKIPVRMNVMFPKLSGESVYSLMALLGSNVVAHNFYVHSSVGQPLELARTSYLYGCLPHEVNSVQGLRVITTQVQGFEEVKCNPRGVVSSAADEVSNPVLMNRLDAVELMHQIFNNPLAPVVFLVILLFSSLVISLTSIIGSDVIVDNFFRVKLPHSVHHLLLKGFAMIPTIYCAKIAGSEGMYQLLLVCPVVQAMLLPSSVIPVFRISSSRPLMARYKITLYVEALAVLAFLLMLFANIIFLAEILFGDSSWTDNMRRNTGSPVVLSYTVILLISCASIAFTLFLAATPLKSASIENDSQELSVHPQMQILGTPRHREETCQENSAHEEVQTFSTDAITRDSLEGRQKSASWRTKYSGSTTESDHDSHYATAHTVTNPGGHPSGSMNREELKSVMVGNADLMPKVRTATKEVRNADNIKMKSTTEKVVEVESVFNTSKGIEVSSDLEFKKSDGGRTQSITSHSSNISGSVSRPSGLGRAARRKLAAILDEFWGHLFDYHGKLTQEANTKSFNYAFAMYMGTASSAVRTDNLSETSWSPLMRDVMQGSATTLNSMNPLSSDRGTSCPRLDFGLRAGTLGTSNWSQSMHRDIPCSSINAESFSNFNVQSYSVNRSYQPATVHGYLLAKYLKEIRASRRPLSSIPLDPWQFPRSSESSLPNYTDSFMHDHNRNVLGSPGCSSSQSPTVNQSSTMLLERSYYDPTSFGGYGNARLSSDTKKYHSSPDISAVIAASKNALLNEADWSCGAAANQSYLGKLACEKSWYLDSAIPSQRACNELSHHSLQRDVLPTPSSMNTKTQSIWTQQPFEQLFSVPSVELNKSEVNTDWRSSITSDFSYIKCEAELVCSVRFCIKNLLELEGSQCLFRDDGGCDEKLISRIADAETVPQGTADDKDANSMHRLRSCGRDCIFQASLIISFGVWCICRVLDLSLVESRPELWGKYTYVLNRLQGILDPAFSKPREPLTSCACLEKAGSVAKPIPGTFTTAAVILDLIKSVEQAVSSRRGRSGTAAGNIAFPKGKENLASVLKRYKRRLASKTPAGSSYGLLRLSFRGRNSGIVVVDIAKAFSCSFPLRIYRIAGCMNSVQSIESLATGDAPHNLFRTLGPTLLISMGYLDLGKWLVAVEAGSRFGYDLVLLVLLFNFSAILCQYLSTCIGMVTGKNIAEICRQEYNQTISVILGLQAGLSLLTSEITMIAGLAVGFNLLFDYDDLITGICFASIVVNLLPYTLSRLDKRMAGMLNACIAGFTLLCFVLGLLVSHPKTPVNMNVMFPKLSGSEKISDSYPCSAADESGNAVIMNFQDAMDLMDQVCTNPAAPVVLLVILLFSSHGISLTCVIGSDVISENFFGIKLPLSANHILPKGIAMIPTIYFAKVTGLEGIYQLLIMCPVIQAMLLPSSVIPILRVSSSRLLMGRYRISMHVETLAFLAFLLMLFTNIIFAAEILFGNSTWTNNLKGDTGGPVLLSYTAVVLISCASIAFTLFLAVTPLKSASNEAETRLSSVFSHRETLHTAHHRVHKEVQGLSVGTVPRGSSEDYQKSAHEHTCGANSLGNFVHEQVQRSSFDIFPKGSLKDQKLDFELSCGAVTTVGSDHGTQQLTAHEDPPASINRKDRKSFVVDWTEPISKACAANILEHSPEENFNMDCSNEKVVEREVGGFIDKDIVVSCNLKSERTAGGNTPLTADGPPYLTWSREKDSNAGNISGSLSRMSGLGRAARRQLAAILDEFWGLLFDYYGELTHEGSTKRFDVSVLLGLTTANPAVRNNNLSVEASLIPLMRDAMRGSGTLLNSWHSVSRDKGIASPEFAFGLQTGAMGSSTWSQSMHLQNRDNPNSGRNLKPYSSLNTQSYTDNQSYQPATIHGYNLATHLSGTNAGRGRNSRIPLDPWKFSRSSESSIPKYTDTELYVHNQNVLGSLGDGSLQSQEMNRLHTTAVERSYYDSKYVVQNGSVDSSAYSKKYHSSPDIYAVIAASRYALPNEVNLGGADADMPELRSLASEKSQFENSAAKPSSQLALNELSHHNVERDILAMQSNTDTSSKSLWDQKPFQQFFGLPSAELSKSDVNIVRRSSSATEAEFSYAEREVELLQSLRFCIMKLLKLEGSRWLFMQNGGCDESLIDLVSEAERVSQEETSDDRGANCMRRLPNCGSDCVWRASLVVSFGVWCIHRVLDLALVESRPELWGKYTYVLNRLQGILDVAFSKTRKPLKPCACLEKAGPVAKPIPGTFTTVVAILEVIKDVEQAVSARKGQSGTAAGDVAFPKGKENLASVLKRYKRRLSSKPSAGQ